MEFTKREYQQFYHGISMSLLSKRSAQKWRYDDETAEEIRFLEGLESKVLDKIRQADTPQTDCNTNQCVQRVEYVGNDEKSRCWTCKHFERMHETPISSDGSYYIYVVCTAKECNYEPKGEPQTDCGWK